MLEISSPRTGPALGRESSYAATPVRTGPQPVAPRSGRKIHNRARPGGQVVQLDLELRERRPALRTELGQRLMARVVHIPRGPFDPAAIVEDPDRSLGLLVLDGLLAIALDAGPAQVGWLVGDEDLIRPWDMDEIVLTRPSSWHALSPARVALLDRDFSRRAGAAPVISRAVVARAAQTTHWLLAKSLVISAPVIEDRLLLLFALLAERWGRVKPDGVWLELPLTHDWLARLCGARRPSVSTALGRLGEEGLLESTHRGRWLLHKQDPSARQARAWAENPCWQRYASAIGFSAARAADGQETPGSADTSVRTLKPLRASHR